MWILLVLIMGSYSACHWDYHLSKYLFKQYCEEEGRVGLFIYEKVELDDEYFMPFPKDKDPRDLDQRFVVGDNLMINRKRFDKEYIFDDYKEIPLSAIGPIFSVETWVLRKGDGKVLGKAVSLTNHLGWWIESSKFGNKDESCPSGRDKYGLWNFHRARRLLIKKVFYGLRES